MKSGIGLLLGLGKGKEKERDEEDEGADDSEKMTHVKAILAAIKDDDAEALEEALTSFVECCDED